MKKFIFLNVLFLTLFSCSETIKPFEYKERYGSPELSDSNAKDQNEESEEEEKQREVEVYTDIEVQLEDQTQAKMKTEVEVQTEKGVHQTEITVQAQVGNLSKHKLHKDLKFVTIPAGKFKMGSPDDEKGRKNNENGKNGKVVEVEISKAFEIMETEVTQSLYEYVMGENPSKFKREEDCDNWDSVKELCPDHPVERISWNDTQEFIKTLNESLGLKNCKGRPDDPSGCYRLPTEAEWEYAARAGTETAYFYGDDPSLLTKYAIFYDNSEGKTTYKVKGNRQANPYGLYDIYGNVQEFVQDAYDKFLPGGKDPLVIASGWWFFKSDIIIRGGSFYKTAHHLRSAFRSHKDQDFNNVNYGFRLVRNL